MAPNAGEDVEQQEHPDVAGGDAECSSPPASRADAKVRLPKSQATGQVPVDARAGSARGSPSSPTAALRPGAAPQQPHPSILESCSYNCLCREQVGSWTGPGKHSAGAGLQHLLPETSSARIWKQPECSTPEAREGGWRRPSVGCSVLAQSGGSGASRVRSVDRKGRDAGTGAPRRPFPSYGLAWAGLAEGGNAEAEPRPPLSALSLCLLREPLPPVRRDRQLALRGLTRTRPPRPPPGTWPSVPRKPSLGEARPEAAEAPVRGRAGRRPQRGLHPPSAPDQEGRGRPSLHELCAAFLGGRQTGRRRPVGVSGPAGRRPPSSRGPWCTAAAGVMLRPFPHFPLWPPDDSRPLQLTGVTCGCHRASQAIPSSPRIARA
ncbi:translation initiation factor IF-2-like [Balaenoptera musculus]|uniref:Translation initiation factor IF-2-like n=1 Tax=Balaenoptera musculus TaxID=9771 RepID=A0A8B8Z6A1_BALMU|nr:translation initiation factor IF-2-like [Balaenoptera musculus]